MRNAMIHSRIRLGLILAALIMPAGVVEAQQHWNQRGGDASRSGFVDISLTVADFTEIWTVPIGYDYTAGTSWARYGREIACDGQAVYITALEGYAPSGYYHVEAYELLTGELRWRTTFIGEAFDGVGSPSAGGGFVYVNRAGHSGTSDPDVIPEADHPWLTAMHVANGAVAFEGAYNAQHGANGRPVLIDDELFAGGGYYGGFYSWNAGDLTKRWFAPNPSGMGYTNPPLAVDAGRVYAWEWIYDRVTGAELTACVDPGAGKLKDPMVGPTDNVFYNTRRALPGGGGADYLVCFERSTRVHAWDFLLDGYSRQYAVGGGKVAVATGSTISILDEATGGVLQQWAISQGPFDVILTQAHVLVSDFDSVQAYDLASGVEQWSAPVGGYMALSDGVLLVRNDDELAAFRVADAPPQTVTIEASADAMAEIKGGILTIDNFGYAMSAQTASMIDLDRRMVMEFPLAGIPHTLEVVSAKLLAEVGSCTTSGGSFGVLIPMGYEGDGVIGNDDIYQPLVAIGY